LPVLPDAEVDERREDMTSTATITAADIQYTLLLVLLSAIESSTSITEYCPMQGS
jgi:hypothetical protein